MKYTGKNKKINSIDFFNSEILKEKKSLKKSLKIEKKIQNYTKTNP